MSAVPLLRVVPDDATPPAAEQYALRPFRMFGRFIDPLPTAVRVLRAEEKRRMRRRASRLKPRATRPATAEPPIILPRSSRRPVAAPRSMLGGESHESLGIPTIAQQTETRRDLIRERWHLMPYEEARFGPPADDRDCPPGTCHHVGCRYHLYLEANGNQIVLNWPGRHVDEIPETCSLRVARAAAARRQESGRSNDCAMSCAEIGRFLNMTQETVRQDLHRALRKLQSAGVRLQ